MPEKPRFTLQLTLRDNRGVESPLICAFDCDQALRISVRAVEDLKMGAELGVTTFDDAVELIRTKELRRKVFIKTAERLAGYLADLMEDAEGWHDPERVEPARSALGGGDWERVG